METVDNYERIINHYRQNPIDYAEDVLGIIPTDQQRELIEGVYQHKRVSCKSGHKVGKTAAISILIHWFMDTHYMPKIICTAPTFNQLNRGLWSELARWHYNKLDLFKDVCDISAEKYYRKNYKGLTWFAAAITARKENPEAFHGYYSDNLMFVFDEASGIPDEIFKAVEGSAQGEDDTPDEDVYMILVGNPLRRSGYFYDTFHDDAEDWHLISLDARESPLTNKKRHGKWLRKYGKDSLEYRVKAMGEFPLYETDALIPANIIEDAISKGKEEIEPLGEIVWGLDPARFGVDECALAKRQGNTIAEVITLKGKVEATELVGWLINEINNTPENERPIRVCIDSIGLGGPIADFLRESDAVSGVEFEDVNVANKASDPEKWYRLRDELWCAYRDWFIDEEPSIPDDRLLFSQSSNIRYKFHSNGSIKIESKDEMKKRNQRSPDRADAVCLTFNRKIEYLCIAP